VGVALGEVVRGKEGAGHDPGVGDLLPLGRLICEHVKHDEQANKSGTDRDSQRKEGNGKGAAARAGWGPRTGVVVGG
jgi:hypothetical protein